MQGVKCLLFLTDTWSYKDKNWVYSETSIDVPVYLTLGRLDKVPSGARRPPKSATASF